jgi:hypothetical protein
LCPIGLAGDIQPDEEALAAGCGDLGGGLASFIFQDVANDELGPFQSENLGDGGADAPGPAADQSYFVLESNLVLS